MHGPRLAGVLTAVAVGPVLIGLLLLWTWKIFRRHQKDLSQDLEPTRLPDPNDPNAYYCFWTNRVFNQVTSLEEIQRAVNKLHFHVTQFGYFCSKKSKTSPTIPLSRLQSYLHELGDGELGDGQHRLPAERLLELIPRNASAFVCHIVSTTIVGAITISDKPHLTIMHPPSVALLTEVFSHGHPHDEIWRTCCAHLRACMAQLVPSEPSNQNATDRLIELLTDVIRDSLGFDPRTDEHLSGFLLGAFKAAIQLGTYLMCHPVEYRFDWVVGDPPSENQVVAFPNMFEDTEDVGLPIFRPRWIHAGEVARLQ